ncbi:carbon monoxide dehydrogenase subunit G [candidate division KSB1 bacterium]|nr:carbon monoxide dehydrogenase subunit G [candidate division KSB1 bacterium]NIR73070.1 carbon monoxide dehydrogenase subunit G [candidate division KSB1 bacterium]NIS28311.1 carbon monoxide dehydrogenase subunit G [candidate division KSB1 bacterium]NIT75180.1 carbon monoxide dehydrogenase subunit G [candidate division KSB1 bacterium]NIU29017.1 carbon monoxide dehydrogenase subunit G [candidate division KSB1 bacterium]
MKLEGSVSLPAPSDKLWDMLQDPEFLKEVMPGCKELKRTGEDQFEGVVGAKVGSIFSQYTTKFTLYDKNPPDSYRLKIEGSGKGGFVQADMKVSLESQDSNETELTYSGEASIGGTIARVGQRLLDAATKMLINKGFKTLKKKVELSLGNK